MKKRKLKLKKKNLLIIIILLVLIVLIYFGIFKLLKKDILINHSISVSCGQSVPSVNKYIKMEYIDDVSESIIWDNLKVKNGKIISTGTFKGKITYGKKDIMVKLSVGDDQKPVIDSKQTIIYNIGDMDTDFTKQIKVMDNCSENLVGTIKGEYDLTKAGSYELTYFVKDESGNETSEKITLLVNNPKNGTTYALSSKGYLIETKNGVTTIDGIIIVNKTYGIASSYEPENMVPFGKTQVIDYVKEAFDEMDNDAKKESLSLTPSTCYRSFSHQSALYNNYVAKDGKAKADNYSARPGHSEHHTGLAIDLSPVNSSFDDTLEGAWIKYNAYKYGFIIRYQKGKEEETGYKYESWHIRYVGKDLAQKLYNGDGTFETLESYFGITSIYDES